MTLYIYIYIYMSSFAISILLLKIPTRGVPFQVRLSGKYMIPQGAGGSTSAFKFKFQYFGSPSHIQNGS